MGIKLSWQNPMNNANLKVSLWCPSLGTHLTRVKLQVTRWRLHIFLAYCPSASCECGSFWGLLRTPSAGTHTKKKQCQPESKMQT